MNPTFFKQSSNFRDWLAQYYNTTQELWVGYYKKGTGKLSITWPESVDEALCFGWIDGIRKSINEDSYMIRFTPRKSTSIWSAVNIKRVEELIPLGLMQPPGITAYKKRTDKKSVQYAYEQKGVKLDAAYEAKIKSNVDAWMFFQSLAPSYKKQSIWWVMSAKREETRLKRLNTLIQSSEEGQKIPSLRRNKE